MNKSIIVVLATLCVACSFFAPVRAADPEPYRLGAEDAITVTVLNHPELSGDALVPSDGAVEFPGSGKMLVVGKTLEEVRTEITKRLSDRLTRPEVAVVLKAQRMQRIYVLGAVNHAGIFDAKATWRITEALAAAGGLSAPEADCTATLLHAATGVVETLTLAGALAGKDEFNVRVAAGDVLTIAPVEQLAIYVMGAVKLPGPQELRAGLGILEALTQAGGATIPPAEGRLLLKRRGQTVATFALDAVLAQTAIGVLPLARGDVLMVEPLRSVRVMVAGAVKAPGFCDLKDGEGPVEAITLAGGQLANAALSRVQILHAGAKPLTVNVDAVLRTGQGGALPPLAAGDVVIVPESTSSVVMLGYVNAPGRYPLQEGKSLRLSEAIALAKGTEVKRGGVSSVALLRTDAAGKQTRQVVNLDKFFKNGDLAANPELQDGDVIYVPETRKPDWSFVFQALTSASLVFRTF